MSQEDSKVQILSKDPIQFAGKAGGLEKFFKLEHWRVKVGDRKPDDRVVWKRGDFVLIVAVTQDGNIVLNREYKQAVERVFLCLPAGAVKKGEKPSTAALRELLEETGYAADEKNCHVIGPFFNSPDKSTERHFVVVVQNAMRQGESDPEESETLLGVQLHQLGLDTMRKMEIGLHCMAIKEATDYLETTNELP